MREADDHALAFVAEIHIARIERESQRIETDFAEVEFLVQLRRHEVGRRAAQPMGYGEKSTHGIEHGDERECCPEFVPSQEINHEA